MAYFFLLVYAAILFIRPMEWIPGIAGWHLLDFVVAAAVMTWLGSLKQSGWKLGDSPQNKLILGFFAATIASHLMHFDPFFGAAGETFIEFGKVILLYFFVASLLDTPRKTRGLLVVVAIGIVFMSFHAILQMHSPTGGLGVTEELRLPHIIHGVIRAKGFGFFDDPNDLALILIASMPFFIRVVIRRGAFMPKRVLAVACLVPIAYAVYLTKSRGGWLALAVTAAAFSAINFGGRRGRKLAVVFGIILLLAIIVYAPGRMGQYDAGDASARGRWSLWGEGMAMFKRCPFFGVGMRRFAEYTDTNQVAHNSYVHCYAELGLFGYFFFLALVLASLRDGYRMTQLKPGEGVPAEAAELADLSRAAVPALIGYLAACFFLTRTYVHPLYIFFGIFAALRRLHAKLGLPAEEMFDIRKHWRRVVLIEFASIVVIWLLTRVMWLRG